MRIILSTLLLFSTLAWAEPFPKDTRDSIKLEVGSLMMLEQHFSKRGKGADSLLRFRCEPAEKARVKVRCYPVDIKYLDKNKAFNLDPVK